ncbi:MAG: AmmeMemoRadiSam system protein B [Deltaproteobacteria bacterium]|nr:AmmeMemoRadiSam system protein B [Deltaproteobacteria bacterium]
MANIRPPAVAGSFYPSAADELDSVLEDCFLTHRLGPRGISSVRPNLFAGIVPHAGYLYSGACAAHFYSCLDSKNLDRVVLLGVNHRSHGHKAALSPWDGWQTPLGKIPVDRALGESLAKLVGWLAYDERPHVSEHSIEVQLPFLQRTLGEFAFLPISLAHISLADCAALGQAIAQVLQREKNCKTVILASSDLNHYLSPQETHRRDELAIAQTLALDPAGLLDVVVKNDITMCGVLPSVAMLYAATALGARQAALLKHCHSGDVKPIQQVVGYASIAVES